MRQDNRRRVASSEGSIEGKAPCANARDTRTEPHRALHRDSPGTALWPVWDTTLHLVVSSRDRLVNARKLVIDQSATIDAACNPFRPDSEVRALKRAHGQPVLMGAVLADLVAVSLRAALLSDGDVNPISGYGTARSRSGAGSRHHPTEAGSAGGRRRRRTGEVSIRTGATSRCRPGHC
jgi:thiamine biosynthesis lipoprotein ApbE